MKVFVILAIFLSIACSAFGQPYLETAHQVRERLTHPMWDILDTYKFPSNNDHEYYKDIQFETNNRGDTIRFTGKNIWLAKRRRRDSVQVIIYTYDAFHRRKSETVAYNARPGYPHNYWGARNVPGFGLIGYSQIEYTYDSLNRVTKLKNFNHGSHRSSVERTYNAQGNISSEAFWAHVIPLYPKKTEIIRKNLITYTYHPNGQLASILQYDQNDLKHHTGYFFNPLGRITKIAYYRNDKPSYNNLGYGELYDHHLLNSLRAMHEFSYQNDTLVVEQIMYGDNDSLCDCAINRITYEYDDLGRIIKKVHYLNGEMTVKRPPIHTFEYNSFGRQMWLRQYSADGTLINMRRAVYDQTPLSRAEEKEEKKRAKHADEDEKTWRKNASKL